MNCYGNGEQAVYGLATAPLMSLPERKAHLPVNVEEFSVSISLPNPELVKAALDRTTQP